MPYFKG